MTGPRGGRIKAPRAVVRSSQITDPPRQSSTMGSLRLVILALAVAAAAAMPRKGRGRPSREQMEQIFEKMFENLKAECLPEDFTEPDFSSCDSETDKRQKLQCIATASGIADASGYSQSGAEAHIDSLSSDADWRAEQKEYLSTCQEMMADRVSTENQGVFMLTCTIQLTMADCREEQLVKLAVAAEPETGEEVAEEFAEMAEGHCFKRLRYPKENRDQWKTCAADAELDMRVLAGAGFFYMKLAMGSEDLPAISAENVTNLAAELEKLDSVVECYSLASGELSADGTINFDQAIASIDSAKGNPMLKEAAKAIVQNCQEDGPENYDEFKDCYLENQQYACAGLKSFAIAEGRGRGRGGRGGRGRGRGGSGGR